MTLDLVFKIVGAIFTLLPYAMWLWVLGAGAKREQKTPREFRENLTAVMGIIICLFLAQLGIFLWLTY